MCFLQNDTGRSETSRGVLWRDKEKKGTKGMNRQSRPERMGWFPAQENAHAETEISLADGGSIPPIST